ncbi:11002_t:CDS:2 [Diversispora eburnea]|uniref:11002_t:CDS:1 n=1 Tax=Diversispora eburnea TaxID=1213867 RepID=A0A9N8ZAH5_9GLOM|nr:11002_t:CDS:2 [Diversispora eburnea]
MSREIVFSYVKAYNIPVSIIGFLMSFSALFGLYVMYRNETARLLKIYSIIAYIIVATLTILEIVNIAIYFGYKDEFESKCYEIIVEDYPYKSQDATSECQEAYSYSVIIGTISAIAYVLASIYFAMVIQSYADIRRNYYLRDTFESGGSSSKGNINININQ